jgi:hypothetical protein
VDRSGILLPGGPDLPHMHQGPAAARITVATVSTSSSTASFSWHIAPLS